MLEPSEDPFWDVKGRERDEEVSLRRQIAAIDAELEVTRRTEAVRHAAGFSDFLKSLETMHRVARERLVGDERLTNEGLREQRGRVRGLESVLALLTNSKEPKQLAERRAALQNVLDEAMRRRPKPKPTEVTSE